MPTRSSASARLIASLLLALLPATTLSAQNATPVFKVTTRIVILDVVVKDKKGNIVTNLAKDDFTVLEDDQPQTIQSFEPPSAHAMPVSLDGKPVVNSAADLPKIGDAPVTILVLDELNTPFNDMSFARSSLTDYLKKQPEVLQQPTLFLVQNDARMLILHDFTQDRDALLKALKNHDPMYPLKAEDMSTNLPVSDPVKNRLRLAQTMQALNQIAEAMRGIPGRKNVIWVGRNYRGVCMVDCGRRAVDPDQITAMHQLTRHMTQTLLEDRVTLYYIDAEDTQQTAFDGRDEYDPKNPFGGKYVIFNYLAPVTGGQEFRQGNFIDVKLKTAQDESTAYYTLSYSPANHQEDPEHYRNTIIRIANHPELTATTRGGYYADAPNANNVVNTPDLAQADRKTLLLFEILQASTSPLTYTGIAVNAKKNDASGTWQISVGPQTLTWTSQTDGALQAEMTTVAVALDAKNNPIMHSSHELVSDRKPDAAAPASIHYEADLKVPPKATRIRFIVRDAVSGKIGTADVTP